MFSFLDDFSYFSNFLSTSFCEFSYCINLMASICILHRHGDCKGKREPSENLCALKNGINEQGINFICKTPEISRVGSYANSRSNCVYCLYTIRGHIVQSRCMCKIFMCYSLDAYV